MSSPKSARMDTPVLPNEGMLAPYDANGDLDIVCKERHFWVSSKTLSEASSVLGKMFAPKLIAKYEPNSMSKVPMELPDVDPAVFKVFCNMLYNYQPSSNPTPTTDLLNSLYAFVEEYKCHKTVSLGAHTWILEDINKRSCEELWTILKFAYGMKLGVLFRTAGKRLIWMRESVPGYRDWAVAVDNYGPMPENVLGWLLPLPYLLLSSC